MPTRLRKPPLRAGSAPTDVAMRAFERSLPIALLRARESVMRFFRPALRRHGVTEQQWRVLRALAARGPLEITELAAQTCLLLPSVSRILPALEARGLIVRRPVASDLRRSIVTLAEGGFELIAAHAPQSERIYRAIEQRFGPERLQQLLELLRLLEDSAALPGVAGRQRVERRRAERPRTPAGARAPRVAPLDAARSPTSEVQKP